MHMSKYKTNYFPNKNFRNNFLLNLFKKYDAIQNLCTHAWSWHILIQNHAISPTLNEI